MTLRTRPIEKSIIFEEKNVLGQVHYVVYEPGNCTRYEVIFTDLCGAFRERTVSVMGVPKRSVLVTLMWNSNRRSMLVNLDNFLFWESVKQDLDVSVHDAVVLAEMIGHVAGCKATTCDEYNANADGSGD